MELYLFRRAEYERLYNCSGWPVDGIPLERRRQFVPEAWLTIWLATIYYVLYIPCLVSIWRRSANNPCYQMLFYTGFLDMLIIPILGFLHGWLTLQGAVFCSYPSLIFWAGMTNNFIWFTVSTVDLALAINRCMEILSSSLAQKFFAGWRVFIWMSLCTSYGLFWLIFVKPALFSSLHFAWFFNPIIGYWEDTDGQFSVPLHSIHDLLVAIGYPLIYLLFVILLKFKISPSTQKISYAQKMTFIQVFILSAMNSITETLYVIMQHTEPRQWMITLGQFGWFHLHAFPPVIYLVFNRTIRNDCRQFLRNIFPKNRVGQLMVKAGLVNVTHASGQAVVTNTNNEGMRQDKDG